MQVRLILHANDPIINRKTRLLNFVEAVSIIVLREFVFVTVLISSYFHSLYGALTRYQL